MSINSPNEDLNTEPGLSSPNFIIGVASHAAPGLLLTAAEMYALQHHLNYPELYEKDAAEIDALAQKISEFLAPYNLKF